MNSLVNSLGIALDNPIYIISGLSGSIRIYFIQHFKLCDQMNQCFLESVFANPEHIEDIRIFVRDLHTLVLRLNSFSDWIITTVHLAIEKVTLLESDESDLKRNLRECKIKLRIAQTYSHTFVDTVQSFFRLADLDPRQVQEMKNAVKTGNKRSLKNYINLIRNCLEKCKRRYTEFLEKFNEAKTLCEEIGRKCEVKKSEAKNKNIMAKVARGGVGVLGLGAPIAVATGFFTFGLGTVAIVGITSIVGVGMAGVGGITAHIAAQKFKTLEVSFKTLCRDMDKLNTEVDDLGPSMIVIERMLETTTDDTDSVEDTGLVEDEDEHQLPEFDLFCGALSLFLDGIKSCRLKLTPHIIPVSIDSQET